MLKEIGHPYSAGKKVYDVTFENVQAGLRTDYLFRLANLHGGLVLGTGDLVGARARLVHLWRRRSDVALCGQCRRAEDLDPISDPLVHRDGQYASQVLATLDSILHTEITPELVPARRGRRSAEHRGVHRPYELQDFNLFYVLRYGFRPAKIAFLAEAAWANVGKGAWPQDFPDDRRHAYDLAQIRRWLEVFIRRFFGFSQFKRSALPKGRRSSPADRCRRAAIGARPPMAMRKPGSTILPAMSRRLRRAPPVS